MNRLTVGVMIEDHLIAENHYFEVAKRFVPMVPTGLGTRIARPQRVQGLLLASHSLPQRGHIIIYLSTFKYTRAQDTFGRHFSCFYPTLQNDK